MLWSKEGGVDWGLDLGSLSNDLIFATIIKITVVTIIVVIIIVVIIIVVIIIIIIVIVITKFSLQSCG